MWSSCIIVFFFKSSPRSNLLQISGFFFLPEFSYAFLFYCCCHFTGGSMPQFAFSFHDLMKEAGKFQFAASHWACFSATHQCKRNVISDSFHECTDYRMALNHCRQFFVSFLCHRCRFCYLQYISGTISFQSLRPTFASQLFFLVPLSVQCQNDQRNECWRMAFIQFHFKIIHTQIGFVYDCWNGTRSKNQIKPSVLWKFLLLYCVRVNCQLF